MVQPRHSRPHARRCGQLICLSAARPRVRITSAPRLGLSWVDNFPPGKDSSKNRASSMVKYCDCKDLRFEPPTRRCKVPVRTATVSTCRVSRTTRYCLFLLVGQEV